MVLDGPFIRYFPVQADQSSDVTLRDVAGLDHVVDELQEVITFLKNPEKFEAMGARPPRVSLRLLGHWKSWYCSC
jgi:ATP-dependent Zn protease